MRRIRSATIAGQRWRIEWEPDPDGDLGYCIKRDRVLNVDPAQPPRELMDTLIHETIHAAKPYAGEKEVTQLAHDISRVLWAAGYRA